jgi:hypothetical protein
MTSTTAAATAADVSAAAVIPRVKANKTTLTTLKPLPDAANPVLGLTADGVYHLKFYLENGRVVIKDVQGNTARVVKPDLDAGYSVIHGIDKVMLSGEFRMQDIKCKCSTYLLLAWLLQAFNRQTA